MTFFESSSRSIFLFEHDLRANVRVCREGKPVSTHRVVARGHAFPDHALGGDAQGHLDAAPYFRPCAGARRHEIEMAGAGNFDKFCGGLLPPHGAGVVMGGVGRNETVKDAADHHDWCFGGRQRCGRNLSVYICRDRRWNQLLEDTWPTVNRHKACESLEVTDAGQTDDRARNKGMGIIKRAGCGKTVPRCRPESKMTACGMSDEDRARQI